MSLWYPINDNFDSTVHTFRFYTIELFLGLFKAFLHLFYYIHHI